MSKNKIVSANDPANIQKAAEILKKGGLVAFPTETVYGLGVDALNALAVAKVFEAKKRPQFDPLIVHVASIEEAASLWKETPKVAMQLMKEFWPGPLTLVLPKKDTVPDIVTAGLPTVAVRMPDHEAALQLIRAFGRPIAAPSANLFGYTSPTTAFAVSEDLEEKIDLVLDGGPSKVGIESTVLKIESDHAVLLRPGGVEVDAIEKFVHVMRSAKQEEGRGGFETRPYESPGQMESHYAPWTNLALMTGDFEAFMREIESFYQLFKQKKMGWPRIGLLLFGERNFPDTDDGSHLFETIEILSASHDLREAASNLFQSIRKLDKINLDIIIAEPLPEKGLGLAIMDRLKKASAGHVPMRDFLNGLIG